MLLDLLAAFNMAYLWSLKTFLHLVSRTPFDEHYTRQPFLHPRHWGRCSCSPMSSSGTPQASSYGCCRQRLLGGPQASGRWPLLLSLGGPRPRGVLGWVWPQQTPLCWDWCGDPCKTLWSECLRKWTLQMTLQSFSFLLLRVCIHFGQKNFFFLFFFMLLH